MPKLLGQPKSKVKLDLEDEVLEDIARGADGELRAKPARYLYSTKDSVGSIGSIGSRVSFGESEEIEHGRSGRGPTPLRSPAPTKEGAGERSAGTRSSKGILRSSASASRGPTMSPSATKDPARRPSMSPSVSKDVSGRRHGSSSPAGTKDQSGRRRTNSSRLGGSSRSPYGSKFRQGSGSRSPGSGRRSPGGGSRQESSDEEDLEEHIDEVPEHLRGAIPLHLREKALPKGTRHLETEAEKFKDEKKVEEKVEEKVVKTRPPPQLEPSPDLPVKVGVGKVRVMCCSVCCWGLVAMVLLWVFSIRLQYTVNSGVHYTVAQSTLSVLQVNTVAELTPGMNLVKSMEFAIRSGLFNTTDLYDRLNLVVLPAMKAMRMIRHVQVAGLMPAAVKYGHGTMHDDKVALNEKQPLVLTFECSSTLDPLSCLDKNATYLEMVPIQGLVTRVMWQGPEYQQKDAIGQVLPPEEWVLGMHLLSLGDLSPSSDPFEVGTTYDPSAKRVALDVALDVRHLSGVAAAACPPGSSAYVYSALNGMLVAGSDWTPGAYADRITGQLVYDRINDLPGRAWSKAISPQDAASAERKEIWFTDDGSNTLIIIEPLAAYGLSPSTEQNLRVAVVVPEAVAVIPILVQFVQASIGLAIAPFAILILWILVFIVFLILRRIVEGIMWSLTEQTEEEPVETDSDDDFFDDDGQHWWQGSRNRADEGIGGAFHNGEAALEGAFGKAAAALHVAPKPPSPSKSTS